MDSDAMRELLLAHSPYHQHTQTEPVEIGDGYAVCRMPLREEHFHAGGVLHGGIGYALADTAVAIAIIVAAGPGKAVFTIEGKLNYFAPVPMGSKGFLYAKAQMLHQGKSTMVANVDVTFEDRAVCHGLFTYAVREAKAG